VWKFVVAPFDRENCESAENPPGTVKMSPSVTVCENEPIVTVVVSGNVPVSWPYAFDPWLLEFAPADVYRMVSEDGLFLLLLSQIMHGWNGTHGGMVVIVVTVVFVVVVEEYVICGSVRGGGGVCIGGGVIFGGGGGGSAGTQGKLYRRVRVATLPHASVATKSTTPSEQHRLSMSKYPTLVDVTE